MLCFNITKLSLRKTKKKLGEKNKCGSIILPISFTVMMP